MHGAEKIETKQNVVEFKLSAVVLNHSSDERKPISNGEVHAAAGESASLMPSRPRSVGAAQVGRFEQLRAVGADLQKDIAHAIDLNGLRRVGAGTAGRALVGAGRRLREKAACLAPPAKDGRRGTG